VINVHDGLWLCVLDDDGREPEETEMATETIGSETTAPPTTPNTSAPKTATITLRAGDSTMRILASRRADGTATTFVTTTDANKKAVRGMTEQHSTWDAAKAAMSKLAKDAEKLGWKRQAAGRGFVARPDAFMTLPVAPKVVTPKAKK
jgi:hypothetical protein